MAKVNVNSASREELVDVAGLRPALAEAIVKHREEHGRIADIDALGDLKGVGAATLEQLKDVLQFGAEKAKETAAKTAEVATTAVRNGAETAKAGVEAAHQAAQRAADKGAEVTSIATRQGAEAAQRGAEAAQRVAGQFAEAGKAAAERSGETAQDLGRLVVDLMNEQVQANVEALQDLARARTWREALEVQNRYVRGNVERASQGASRYVEAVTKLVAGVAQAGREQARKAA
jgi:competence ComEA-like helix-hairpin-helix protein/phasin family protein